MKLSLLLTTLLLSASPALADDFVYLKCDALVSALTKQVITNEVLSDVQEQEQRFFKVDVTNSRVKEQTGRWDDDPCKWCCLFQRYDVYEGATIVGEFMLEYSPAGRVSIQATTTFDEVIGKMSVNGTCQISDEMTLRKLQANETPTSPHNLASYSITCTCKQK